MGYTFVFDMDQTLVDYDRVEKKIVLNKKLMEILKKIHEGRSTGITDAVFLYTNNSDEKYVYRVEALIEYEVPGFKFDDMMWAKDDRRSSYRIYQEVNPPKLLEDVATMLEDRNIFKNDAYLRNNVFFFDDIPNHYIINEIIPEHYIHITPPFRVDSEPDSLIYQPVYDVLDAPKTGGRRNTIRRKRLAIKRRNKKWSLRRLRKPGPKRSQNAF
jgi:hypothetical protein